MLTERAGVSNALLLMVVICHKMITKHMHLLQNQQETMRLNLRCANISVPNSSKSRKKVCVHFKVCARFLGALKNLCL